MQSEQPTSHARSHVGEGNLLTWFQGSARCDPPFANDAKGRPIKKALSDREELSVDVEDYAAVGGQLRGAVVGYGEDDVGDTWALAGRA